MALCNFSCKVIRKKRLTTKEILDKYGSKIEGQIETEGTSFDADYSSSYVKFKEEMAPEINRYEKWCKSLGSVIKINVSENDFRFSKIYEGSIFQRGT